MPDAFESERAMNTQLTNENLLLESKVQLKATDKTISEIAYYLKLDDPPHFTNFIKKRTVLSPQELRRKL